MASRLIAALFCALILVGGGTARADDSARQKLFIELYEVMRYDSVLAQMTNTLGASIESALRQKFPNIDRETLKDVRAVVEETYADLKPQMVKFSGTFIVQNFTEDDIKIMIAFYKTPTGQKALTLMPKMMQEMMGWLTPAMQTLQTELKGKLRERLKSRGYEL